MKDGFTGGRHEDQSGGGGQGHDAGPARAEAAGSGRVHEAVCLRAFDGTDGVDAAPGELRLYRAGELLETLSGPAVEERAAGLDPHTAPAGPCSFEWAAAVARLFPGRLFCLDDPVSFDLAARVGTGELDEDLRGAGTSIRAFYDASPFESFDGELVFDRVASGRLAMEDLEQARPRPMAGEHVRADTGHRGGYREWRRDVANLSDYPEHRRRVVELTLPRSAPELRGREEDLPLLYRIAVAVTELVRRYILTGGEWIAYEPPGRVDNVFAGGEPGPLPRRVAPVIYGRSVNDVYRRAEPERLIGG